MTPRGAAAARALLPMVVIMAFAEVLLPARARPGDGPVSRSGYSVYAAGMAGPRGLLFGPGGLLHAVEQSAGTVVRILPGGRVERIARGLSAPHDLAIDASGTLYVAETGAGRIARISPDGKAQTYIDDVEEPVDLAFHPGGELFVCELGAGRVSAYRSPREKRVVVSGMGGPHGLAFAGARVAYVNDWSRNSVVAVDANGRVRTVAEVEDPVGIAIGRSGDLYVAQPQVGTVARVKIDGTRVVLIEGLNGPRDPVFDDAGNLYVAETGAGRILMIEGDF